MTDIAFIEQLEFMVADVSIGKFAVLKFNQRSFRNGWLNEIVSAEQVSKDSRTVELPQCNIGRHACLDGIPDFLSADNGGLLKGLDFGEVLFSKGEGVFELLLFTKHA